MPTLWMTLFALEGFNESSCALLCIGGGEVYICQTDQFVLILVLPKFSKPDLIYEQE